MSQLRWLWIPCLILMITGCTSCGGGQTGGGVVIVTPTFDQVRAFAALAQQCAFGPRLPGSQAHADCLEWLVTQLAGADRVIRQNFSSTTPLGGAQSYDFTNVLALFGQDKPGVPFLLVAHWDSRPKADNDPNPANHDQPVMGANDGASGVAVLLEIARLMLTSPPPRPVIIALVDAEDSGSAASGLPYMGFCLGAKYLAEHWPGDLAKPAEGILLDMVGDPGARFRKESYSVGYNNALVTRVWNAAAARGHAAFASVAGSAVTDDHRPLNEQGSIRVIDIIDFFPPPDTWHTVNDTPANCSADMLNQVGDTLLQVLYGAG